MSSGFQHAARLDVDLVLGQLAKAAGLRLTAAGACPAGQVGASYVRWPDGRRSVLTWQPAGAAAGAAAWYGSPWPTTWRWRAGRI